MIKFTHEKTKAYRFALDIEGDTNKYALSLLNIINNAREYPQAFYKVENTCSNLVYITCNEKEKANVRKYIENFGKIEDEEIINWVVVNVECDLKGYNELYEDDIETDFTITDQ